MITSYTKTFSFTVLAGMLGLFSFSHSSAAYALIDLNVGASATVTGGGNEAVTNSMVESTLSVTRQEISTEEETEVDARAVSTGNDLRAYAYTAMRADPLVEGMNFARDSVEVRYKEQAKFLALLPMSFTVSAQVHANGEVTVDYPWYSFLTVDNHDKIETEIKIAVDNALRSRMVGSVQAEGEVANRSFSAAESAEIAAQMQRVLQANVMASTEEQTAGY